MTHKYFLAYTRTNIQQFHDTLIQYVESVKKSIDERALHKREYANTVNERQMQTKEGQVDTSKELDDSLVVTESSDTEFEEQNTSSSSGNDIDVDDTYIKLIYDEEPMVDVQLTAECNVLVMNNGILSNLNSIMKESGICLTTHTVYP
nr:hypothetical protein [Tanacetum cinerariifolium]